ncbi:MULTISPECIES: aromatic amino acid transport family protein [unclassified Pseudodesulfovibrio]|uniref:aromatic amino acid transport family protein n=1 Tax=unclassified Pseudodesulfovibrio TaxID=2661612 RepID=UPI000FEBAFB2|nr:MULTISPECIES: aromatic amino acid transport family protein [unclassified Pseudodesulfovibrio]MCJ2165027.1 tryptophan/tyrosine permease [Pseudodesulfovibrio sp. S3-i]RWU03532.1 tryptophan/tyrosine permease [Pseudodesulfovibrio sp. S3]
MNSGGSSRGKIVTTALIITGNMVGAGILALPINIGPAGILPALSGALAVWVVMTCTGLIIARQPFLAQNRDADLPTFFGAVLGPAGKWLSVGANLVILYGLLTAYLAGVASVAVSSFDVGIPEWGMMLVYFCIATLLASFGSAVLRRGNALLMGAMWLLFGLLLVMVVPHFRGIDLRAGDIMFFSSGLPILVTAFNFHNVVPTLCRVLDHDRRSITIAIWLGSGIGAFMTLLWTVAVILTLPMEAADGVSIIAAFQAGVPATVPLNNLIGSPWFVNASIAFAVVAMTTSYMATGVSLLAFLKDVAGTTIRSRVVIWFMAFVPPVGIGILFPNIFLKALNIVGGFGVGTLFGILPGLLLIRQGTAGSAMRRSGWALVAFFGCVLMVELAQEFGMLHISPDVEYWSQHVFK